MKGQRKDETPRIYYVPITISPKGIANALFILFLFILLDHVILLCKVEKRKQ